METHNSMNRHEEVASNRPACASCKHQRKKCSANCVMASHFPARRMHEFQEVHKVFGIANVSKAVKKLDLPQQEEAVKSFVWEALMWKQDPVHGPLGQYRRLEEENNLLKQQVGSYLPWNHHNNGDLVLIEPPLHNYMYNGFGQGRGSHGRNYCTTLSFRHGEASSSYASEEREGLERGNNGNGAVELPIVQRQEREIQRVDGLDLDAVCKLCLTDPYQCRNIISDGFHEVRDSTWENSG